MAIYASDSGGREFKKIPPGCYFAICNMVVDLGVQETTFKREAKQQRKVYLRWEVPSERTTFEPKDGPSKEGPMCIGATYTLSLSDKANLRRVLENWRQRQFTPEELKKFDITAVAGKCCQVMIQHETGADGKTYTKVTGIMGVSAEQREKARVAKAENPVLVYSVDEPDEVVFNQLPNWIKEKIGERVMPKPMPMAQADGVLAGGPVDDWDDPIPF